MGYILLIVVLIKCTYEGKQSAVNCGGFKFYPKSIAQYAIKCHLVIDKGCIHCPKQSGIISPPGGMESGTIITLWRSVWDLPPLSTGAASLFMETQNIRFQNILWDLCGSASRFFDILTDVWNRGLQEAIDRVAPSSALYYLGCLVYELTDSNLMMKQQEHFLEPSWRFMK